jgi:hypothetical protein
MSVHNQTNDRPGTSLSVSMNQLEGASLKRRSLLGGLLATLAFLVNGFGISSRAIAAPMPTEEELRPFREIAARKGAKFLYGSAKRLPMDGSRMKMHLDMDMVRASIDNAIARTKVPAIKERLERLRSKGTAAQQVDFVLGSGKNYFFPEDVERWAALAEENKFATFGVVCNTVCYLICKCFCNDKDCVQQCNQDCHDVFCPDPK